MSKFRGGEVTDAVIYKFELEIVDEQVLSCGPVVSFLDCQSQNGKLCLWALMRPSYRSATYVIRVIGTGRPIPDYHQLKHIASVQQGPAVWHVFLKEAVDLSQLELQMLGATK